MENENKRLAKARYISGFDGIRTIAVIGVILYHLAPNFMRGGYLGVPIFFVVSGYLITDLLRQEYLQNKEIDIPAFYKRRMKRLYPGLAVMLVASSFYITLFQHNLLSNLRGAVISSLTYVNNWWQIAKGASYFDRFANESPFSHIWSLAVEGQYYFLWPIVFFLLIRYVKKSGRIFNILFIAGIISAVLMGVLFKSSADPTRVYYGTDTRLFSILLGTGLAFVWPSWKMKARMKPQPKKFLNRVGLVSLILIIASFVFLADNWTFVYRGGMYLFSLISMVFVALVAHPGLSWNKWLTNPVFTYIGKRSYGIYLWQFPIMIFYEAKVNDVGNHVVLHTIVELILIFGISELSYRFVEQPLKKLDYSTVIPKLKELFQAPYLERDKIIGYVISVITLVALVGIIISPVNGKSPDQKALEESIATNKAKNEQHQKEVEKAESENKPAVVEIDPEATLSKRYDLTKQQLNAASKMKITAFGDSVMLASSDDLNEVFPYMMIDADVGRQLYNSYDALQKLKTDGELADTVLVSLGTNGSFTQQQFDDFMKIIGKKREVYWMSVRVPTKRWQNTVNDMLKDEEKKYSNLHLVDWYKLSEAQKDWFYPDKVHPNDTGKPYYTRLVAQSLLTKENVAKVEASEKAAKEKEAAEKKAKADAAKGTSSTSSSAKKTSSSTKKAN